MPEKKKKNDPIAQQKRTFLVVAICLCIVLLLGLFFLSYVLVVVVPARAVFEQTTEAIRATNYSGVALINQTQAAEAIATGTSQS